MSLEARVAPRARQRERETKLRVASVYRTFSDFGSIPSLYRRSATLLSHDVELTLFCSRHGRAPGDAPLTFHDVEPLLRGSGRFRYAIECASFAIRASRAVSKERAAFDVVHAEGFALLRADAVTVHAVRAAEIERYFRRIEPRATARRILSPYVFQPQAAVVLEIERRLFRCSTPPFCIAASEQIKRDLAHYHGVPPEVVEVVPYGVDTDRLKFDARARARHRAALGVQDEATVALFVGDSFLRKGLDTAIKAVAASRTRPELWVIGGDDTSRYAKLAAGLGVARQVRFLGRRSQDELAGLYSAGDILVLPSRNDAWGLPPVEAMVSGRVPVVSSFTGSSEAIEHGTNGYVLNGAGDATEIAELLDGPLADPLKRRALGSAAANDARAFAWQNVYPRLLEAHHRAYELRQSRLRAA